MRVFIFILILIFGFIAALLFTTLSFMIVEFDIIAFARVFSNANIVTGMQNSEFYKLTYLCLNFVLFLYFSFRGIAKVFYRKTFLTLNMKIIFYLFVFFFFHALIFILLYSLGLKSDSNDKNAFLAAVAVTIAVSAFITRFVFKFLKGKYEVFKNLYNLSK